MSRSFVLSKMPLPEHRNGPAPAVTQINAHSVPEGYSFFHGTMPIGKRVESQLRRPGAESGRPGDFRPVRFREVETPVKARKDGPCADGIKRIDGALNNTYGAMLTLEQFDEVTRLRREIRICCDAGREDDARIALDRALQILGLKSRG